MPFFIIKSFIIKSFMVKIFIVLTDLMTEKIDQVNHMSIAGLLANDLNATVYDDTGEPINKENTQAMRELAINFGR